MPEIPGVAVEEERLAAWMTCESFVVVERGTPLCEARQRFGLGHTRCHRRRCRRSAGLISKVRCHARRLRRAHVAEVANRARCDCLTCARPCLSGSQPPASSPSSSSAGRSGSAPSTAPSTCSRRAPPTVPSGATGVAAPAMSLSGRQRSSRCCALARSCGGRRGDRRCSGSHDPEGSRCGPSSARARRPRQRSDPSSRNPNAVSPSPRVL